jgi:DNA-binding transcriptional ArsR family regulator
MISLNHLFPKTRAEILRMLFESADRESHLRDLARMADLSPASLQKELASLASLELITARRDGNRLYYRANTAHPIYPELHGLVIKTAGIAAALRLALSTVEGVDLALIFGSTAAGTATGQSDVDLLVLGTAGLRKITPALRGIAENLGREINPVCLTPAEWREKQQRGDAFVSRITREPQIRLKGTSDAFAAMGI